MKIDGQCHCGNISYTAEIDPGEVVICHCTDCQSLSATAFRTIVVVPAEKFDLSGDIKIYIKTGGSGNKRQQAFCPHCGSAIYAAANEDMPAIYKLRLGTARQRHELVPTKQKWAGSAINWLDKLSSIPKMEKQ